MLNQSIHCLFGIKSFITPSSTILERQKVAHGHNDVTYAH